MGSIDPLRKTSLWSGSGPGGAPCHRDGAKDHQAGEAVQPSGQGKALLSIP